MLVYGNTFDLETKRFTDYAFDKTVTMYPDTDCWLITIDEDRYNGVYSHFKYTAWLGDRPEDIGAGDPDCMSFWDTYRDKAVCGFGNTPSDAFFDLVAKLEAMGFDVVDYEEPKYSRIKIIRLAKCVDDDEYFLFDSPELRTWLGLDKTIALPKEDSVV